MASRYGSRGRSGSKSILAKRKRTASGDHKAAPKSRKNVSMLSDAALIGMVETGRPRDRSKFIKELDKRSLKRPIQVGQPIEASA